MGPHRVITRTIDLERLLMRACALALALAEDIERLPTDRVCLDQVKFHATVRELRELLADADEPDGIEHVYRIVALSERLATTLVEAALLLEQYPDVAEEEVSATTQSILPVPSLPARRERRRSVDEP